MFSRTLLFFAFTASAFATTVWVQPPTQIVETGQFVIVDVDIDTVSDLYGWQFDLSFDPSILSALAVTEGSFLTSGGTTFFVGGAIDNVGGTITFNADILIGAIAGVSGSGQLAEFQFQTLSEGTSPLTLANVSLLDSGLNSISATTTDGSASVVPEPSSTVLTILALSMFLLCAFAARRNRLLRAVAIAATIVSCIGAADIPTAQIDSSRTSSYGSEIFLTTANVNGSRFGRIFSRTVDGAIFAQPVYLQGLTIASKKVNVVYVATAHNNVYAFDADSPGAPSPLWTVNLGASVAVSGWTTNLGILSTPLIVRSSGAIYIVAPTFENGSRVYRLHALDIVTGAEKFGGPVIIAGSVAGTAGDAVNGIITFDANSHVQRTGLALAGNNVVLAFSADRDHPPYHGWVFSYNVATLSPTGIFNDALNNVWDFGTGAGIWQSGRAPAVDPAGTVYLETGNGAFDGTLDFGESFLKLSTGSGGLALADWFTPSAWNAFNAVDYDLSSTGPTLIPGASLVFGGAKSGTIYLLSTNNLGQLSSNDANIVQSFTATSGCVIPFIDQGCAQIMGQAFWPTAATPTLYVWGVHDILRSYTFNSGKFNTTPSGLGSSPSNYPGGMLELSSYLGTAGTGILWAVTNDTPDQGNYFGPGVSWSGTLHAFDAANVSHELWNSSQNPSRDGLGLFSTFGLPITANGKVYVPTFSNQLVVYGLLNGPVAGDVNGDSVVNCADLAIVKASYGKSTGQVGFDLRADVNSDGIVNIIDLATVSRQVPAGTVCR